MTPDTVVAFPGKRGKKKPPELPEHEPEAFEPNRPNPTENEPEPPQPATGQTVAAGQLRAIIERAERLYEEDKEIKDLLKDLWAEAKGTGFHVKTLKTIIKMRRQDVNERHEEEALLDLYKAALGMA